MPIAQNLVLLVSAVALATSASRTPAATITMREYAFEMDSTLPVGKHVIALRNTGRHRHMVLLTRLAPGKSSSDVAEWLEHRDRAAPGELVVASAELKSKEESTLTVDLVPGRYSLVCTVRGWWNRPHYKSGMSREVVVVEARASDTAAVVVRAR